jgi:hypothetical protein
MEGTVAPDRILKALGQLFVDRARIVFWHDPEREFEETLAVLDLGNVAQLHLNENGALAVKVHLEQKDPTGRYLLYAPFDPPEPNYVVSLQGKIVARIDKLADDIQSATTSAQAKRLQKERDKLTRQLDELRRYDEQLRHYADLRIKLDLDDGVKVNYGKFGNLLAEVKAVTGKR